MAKHSLSAERCAFGRTGATFLTDGDAVISHFIIGANGCDFSAVSDRGQRYRLLDAADCRYSPQLVALGRLRKNRSLVRAGFSYHRGDAAITRAIAAMAQSLGLHIVAEGVENEEQLQFLR